jgi:type VI secretion system protein
MSLTLSIRNRERLPPDVETSKTLSGGRLRIGRRSDNDWVLPDPSSIVHRKHCMIDGDGATFRLHVLGENGVYLNGAAERLPAGRTVQLSDGDRLGIGGYEISVALTEAPEAPRPTDTLLEFDRELAPDPFATASDALLPPQPVKPPSDEVRPSPSINDHLPPQKIPSIQDIIKGKTPPVHEEPPKGPEPFPGAPPDVKLATGPAIRTAKPEPRATPPPGRTREVENVELLNAFLAGAGLQDLNLSPERAREVMETIGQIFREAVEGVIKVLEARRQFKYEFHIARTIVMDNPLKVSMNAEDAMMALLGVRRGSGLPPAEAFRQIFEDIAAHDAGTMVGLQDALANLLRRFDPKQVEASLKEEGGGLARYLGLGGARSWAAFKQRYRLLVDEAEDDFYSVFGRVFARAYEEQVNQLRARRR